MTQQISIEEPGFQEPSLDEPMPEQTEHDQVEYNILQTTGLEGQTYMGHQQTTAAAMLTCPSCGAHCVAGTRACPRCGALF